MYQNIFVSLLSDQESEARSVISHVPRRKATAIILLK